MQVKNDLRCLRQICMNFQTNILIHVNFTILLRSVVVLSFYVLVFKKNFFLIAPFPDLCLLVHFITFVHELLDIPTYFDRLWKVIYV